MCLRSINSFQGAHTVQKSLIFFSKSSTSAGEGFGICLAQGSHCTKCTIYLWLIELSVMFFLIQLVTLGCELAMVFGGVVPYIPQYWQIKQKQTTQVWYLSGILTKIINFLTGLLPSRLPGIIVGQHPPHHLLVRQAIWDPSPCSGFFLENFIKSNAPVMT